MKLPIQIKILIGLLILGVLYSIGSAIFTGFTTFYNSNQSYIYNNDQLIHTQITTFDNNYLAFKDKSNIADLSKETFVKVTEIIMSNRKDGQQLAWKWVSENQQIPYEEFTKFYVDLSSFTQERFVENNKIELQRQNLVKNQNLLITSFPGNIYNHFLKFQKLEYKEGFISLDTKNLFKK